MDISCLMFMLSGVYLYGVAEDKRVNSLTRVNFKMYFSFKTKMKTKKKCLVFCAEGQATPINTSKQYNTSILIFNLGPPSVHPNPSSSISVPLSFIPIPPD